MLRSNNSILLSLSSIIILIFVIGYLSITLEHPLKLDKTVPALIMGAACWAFISLGGLQVVGADHLVGEMDDVLLHHIGKVAEILSDYRKHATYC
mgnify:CR=1 FL=1